MLPRFSYSRPKTIEQAVEALSVPGSRVHAGGTDLLGCIRDGVMQVEMIVSLAGIESLKGIETTTDGGLRIGAMTTIAEIAADEKVGAMFPVLRSAASQVATPQLRNQGTLAGNLCQRPRCWYYRSGFDCARKGGDTCYAYEGENRYHAVISDGACFIVHPSDTAVAMTALEGLVRIAGPDGERSVPAGEFFVGPEEDITKENVLGKGEIVTEVILPAARAGERGAYRKERERGSWDFALASAAASIEMQAGTVSRAAIALGGVCPVPYRAGQAEKVLLGESLNEAAVAKAAEAAVSDAAPLAQNAYKIDLVKGLLQDLLLGL